MLELQHHWQAGCEAAGMGNLPDQPEQGRGAEARWAQHPVKLASGKIDGLVWVHGGHAHVCRACARLEDGCWGVAEPLLVCVPPDHASFAATQETAFSAST